MDWANIISAILAGGLAGQITTLFLSQRLQSKRERDSWMRAERFRVFAELLDHVSAYASKEDFQEWPEQIRVASQKVHLLSGPDGNATEALTVLLQRAFQLALHRKLGKVNDFKEWRDQMRETSSSIRRELATVLHS